ncbi:MAG: DNA cytosine methyltransferase [Burkholderiales bacterium]|nr:MAG: DNA cytosine methyltransferase [Burkholderiales bacterium]
MKMVKHVVCVDFFSGAGGMTNGLISAGVHVLAGVDNEPGCEKTYVQNNKNKNGSRPEFICKNIFPKSTIHPTGQQAEIRQRIEQLIRRYKRENNVKAVSLVFAICAPCQPFTKITKIEMTDGRQFKRANDANLLLTTLDLIKHFKPAAIICENVEGMVTREDAVILQFKARLKRLGYSFDVKVINAIDFGVPQNRKRTIGIGLRTVIAGCKADVPTKDPRVIAPKTVEEAIGYLPAIAAGEVHPKIKNHRTRALNDLNLKRISSVRPGESNLVLKHTKYGDLSLDCHRNLEERAGKPSFTDTYTRMRANAPSPTITTKCLSITNGRFGHYDTTQNRGLSAKEAALLQTFPRTFVFYPVENIQFTALLIGNAVPPKLAKFFGNYVVQKLPD